MREGYYNVQLMLGKVMRKGEVALCGTCMGARGLRDEALIDGGEAPHLGAVGRLDRRSRQDPGLLNSARHKP